MICILIFFRLFFRYRPKSKCMCCSYWSFIIVFIIFEANWTYGTENDKFIRSSQTQRTVGKYWFRCIACVFWFTSFGWGLSFLWWMHYTIMGQRRWPLHIQTNHVVSQIQIDSKLYSVWRQKRQIGTPWKRQIGAYSKCIWQMEHMHHKNHLYLYLMSRSQQWHINAYHLRAREDDATSALRETIKMFLQLNANSVQNSYVQNINSTLVCIVQKKLHKNKFFVKIIHK